MYDSQSQEFSFVNSKGSNLSLTLKPTGIFISKKKERFIGVDQVLGARDYFVKETKRLKIELLFLERSTNKQGLKTYVPVIIELLNDDE